MQDINRVEIRGTISSDPVYRDTRNNSRMAAFTVVVKRREPSAAKDFLDVIAWGETARTMEGEFSQGDRVELEGYIRKQFYVDDKGERKNRCQIIAESIVHPAEDVNVILPPPEPEAYGEAAA